MKNRQTRIIMLILVGLVLFSSSLALLMYTKQVDAQKKVQKLVEVYVAAKEIRKGDLVSADTMKLVKLPQSYIESTPLSPADILGKYALEDIYPKEIFRKEKLSLKKPQMQEVSENNVSNAQERKNVSPQMQNDLDTLSLPLTLFKNIDSSLKKGDFIDIVSVKSSGSNRAAIKDFSVKYVALHVPIYSFVSNANFINGYKTQTNTEKSVVVKADTIVLEVSPKNIKNLLALHYKTQALNKDRVYNTKNKGHLWIVKCAKDTNETIEAKKERMLADYVSKRVKVKRARKRKESVSISYEK